MNRTFLDTSFIIALINNKDAYFKKAQELAPDYMRDHLITTDAVLFEIGNALAKDFKAKAVEIIKILRSTEKTDVRVIDSELFGKGLALYEEYQDKKWGLVDCISFIVMREQGIINALTHDRHFEQAGFRAHCASR